jgi:FMN reductase
MTIVGLGGSLRRASTSRAALERALAGAEAAGADTVLLDLRELGLPMFDPEHEEPTGPAEELVETCYAATAMIWSSPLYQGTISGAFKNALDWLHVLGRRDPPYLHDKVIGLISAAGGTQGLQAINTMEFSVRSLRGWAVPYVVPIASAAGVFAEDGSVREESVAGQLALLGEEVVRVAQKFVSEPAMHREAECAEAAERVFAGAG